MSSAVAQLSFQGNVIRDGVIAYISGEIGEYSVPLATGGRGVVRAGGLGESFQHGLKRSRSPCRDLDL